ncbi:MAG: hypothetical protein HC897_03485 [Thermoanaerobaculia bacterium]|nr:hypothetical protein [Thermoanaerobaculia bacterium]
MKNGRNVAGLRKAWIFTALVLAAAFLTASAAHADKPFQELVSFTVAWGQASNCQAFSIPTGQELTVEFTSVVVEASTTGQEVTVVLFTSIDSDPESFNVIPVTKNGAGDTFHGAHVLKAYADSDLTNSPRLCVSRVNTSAILTIYGSLVGTLEAD